MGKVELFIVMFIAWLLFSYLAVLLDGIIARLLGISVDIYGLNIGPKLFQFRLGKVLLRVNWLPLGSYVRFKEYDPFDNSVIDLYPHPSEPNTYAIASPAAGVYFSDKPRWKRTVMIITSQIIILAIGMLMVGSQSLATIRGTFPWLGHMLLAPKTDGANIVAGYFASVREHGVLYGVGVLAICSPLLNMLPFGAMRGWMFVTNIFTATSTLIIDRTRKPASNLLGCIGIAGSMALVVVMWTAIISYLINPSLK